MKTQKEGVSQMQASPSNHVQKLCIKNKVRKQCGNFASVKSSLCLPIRLWSFRLEIVRCGKDPVLDTSLVSGRYFVLTWF